MGNMNSTDHQLERLLKAASQVSEEPDALPGSFERRILEAWQRERGVANRDAAVVRVMGWAVGGSCAVLVACLVWAQDRDPQQDSEALSLVNSSIHLSLLP